MTVGWKAWKTLLLEREHPKVHAGFPTLPTALGNRCAIPTFPQPRTRDSLFKPRDTSIELPPGTFLSRLDTGTKLP